MVWNPDLPVLTPGKFTLKIIETRRDKSIFSVRVPLKGITDLFPRIGICFSLQNYQSQCNCNNRRVGDEFSERSVLHSSLRTTAIMDWPMRIRTKRMDRTGLFVIGGAFQIGILLHSAKSLWSIGIRWQKENDIWKGKIGRIGHLPIWFVIIQSERITDWRSLPFSLRPDQGTKNNPALNQSHNSSGMALGRLKNTIFPNLNKYPGGEDKKKSRVMVLWLFSSGSPK